MASNPPYYISAYALAVKHGFTGSIDQWLASLKGDKAYLHIKYAAAQPAQDGDMKDTPDKWMGVLADNMEAASSSYASYAWNKVGGDQGDPGVSYYVHFKYSANMPTQDSDMKDEPDRWMGTLTDSNPVASTSYADYSWYDRGGGLGAVSSVNGKTGAVTLTAEDVDALPSDTQIPEKTSELSNDSGFITAEDAPVKSVNGMTGAVTINRVPLADNLTSPDNQEIYDAFIFRTSGGAASINSGKAQLAIVRGRVTITGRVPEVLNTTETEGLTVSVDKTAWRVAVNESGTYAFSYDGTDWKLSGSVVALANYGITVNGIQSESISHTEPESLTVTIDAATWREAVSNGGTYTFSYDGTNWKQGGSVVTLASYGMSITGTPESGDVVVVNYAKATSSANISVAYTKGEQGTINIATPYTFKSIGLNQFDKATMILSGYTISTTGAVVAEAGKYIAYIHAVGGLTDGYTVRSAAGVIIRTGWLASIPTTTTSGISLDGVTGDGNTSYITPAEDGYICVAVSGIDDLCVHPKWSGYEDETYEDYSESVITIPTADADGAALPTASYGMPALGSVCDELNLDLKTYTKRIGQLAFNVQNLASVKAMGVAYDYDATNIFYVLAVPIVYTLDSTVSDAYTAADFGTEEFTSTSVAPYAQNLYGDNLRDKLRTDVLTISAQVLTASQKAGVNSRLGTQGLFPVINVKAASGSTVTATLGSVILTAAADASDNCSFTVEQRGGWVISDGTHSKTVNVTNCTDYSVDLRVTIMGISRSTLATSTLWTRTDAAVGKTATGSIGSSAGSSDFDTMPIYKDIERETLPTVDVMVKIPKFWYRRFRDADNVEYIKIADKAADDFVLHPAFLRDGVTYDHIYVGAYKTTAGHTSKAGLAPLVNQTRAAFRTGATTKGNGWHLIDLAAVAAVQMLMLVEFANNDVQAAIGEGYSASGHTAAINTGSCDAVPNLTGRPAGTSNNVEVVWRGIEGFWGNVWEWCDGLNFNNGVYYVSNNPAVYADDTATGYTPLDYQGSTAWSGSYITALGLDTANPWAAMPSVAGSGSATTGFADGAWSSTGWRVFKRGGDWNHGSLDGLFACAVGDASSAASTSVGGRLLFLTP